jgi:hypothetical protein
VSTVRWNLKGMRRSTGPSAVSARSPTTDSPLAKDQLRKLGDRPEILYA